MRLSDESVIEGGHLTPEERIALQAEEIKQLRAQVSKPTIEQVAWIAKCICQNADEHGTFRHLIYDIMGYGGEAYQPLCEAGLLRINNSMTELTPEQVEALQQENEQLKEQINTAKIGWDTYKTYSEQLEQQTVELLRKARKALHEGISELKFHCEYFNQTPEEDACIEMHEAIVEIDKMIGGEEDV